MEKMLHGPVDPLDYHANLFTRIYFDEQRHRVMKSREYLSMAFDLCEKDRPDIIELGCGALDISGAFSDKTKVTGIECNPQYSEIKEMRYPEVNLIVGDVNQMEGSSCDILVACEILEHLVDPNAVMDKFMPLANYAVVSHPIDEPPYNRETEHHWSFSENDFLLWFERQSYCLLHKEQFHNGNLTIIIGVGAKKIEVERTAGKE